MNYLEIISENAIYLSRVKTDKVKLHNDEIFVRLPWSDKYFISQHGNLYSEYTKHLIKSQLRGAKKQRQQRLSYRLKHPDGIKRNHYVHRLVASAFVENSNPLIKTQVHHLDADCFNNHYENLMWVDPREHRLIEAGIELYLYDVSNDYLEKFRSFKELEVAVGATNLSAKIRKSNPHFMLPDGMECYRFDKIIFNDAPLHIAIKRLNYTLAATA